MKSKIIAVCGKSASGKTTLARWLSQLYPTAFHTILSATTRPRRDYEREGIDYSFIDDQTFTNLINQNAFLEYEDFKGWHYGSLKNSLVKDKINIGVFNLQGIRTLMNNPDIKLFIIYAAASGRTRLLRSLSRENNPDVNEVVRRYERDEADFRDIKDIQKWPRFFAFDNETQDDLIEAIKGISSWAKVFNES